MLHCFFLFGALVSAYRLDQLHALLYGWLCKEGPLLEFFQNAGAFIFLFEASDCTIDGFIFVDNDSYQVFHLP